MFVVYMARVCELMGVRRMVGHNVSKSNRKTRAVFLPNLSVVRCKSEVLGKNFALRLSKRAARTLQKYGSLDAMVQNMSGAKLAQQGLKIRSAVRKKLKKQADKK